MKAFVRDEYEEEKFAEVNTDLTSSSETTFHYAVLNLPAFQAVMYSAIVLIMWFGGNMILKSNLAVGDLTGFLSYVMQVMNSLMMIANVVPSAYPFPCQRPPYCGSSGRTGGTGFPGKRAGAGSRRKY